MADPVISEARAIFRRLESLDMSDSSLWRMGQVIGVYLGRGHCQTRSDRYGTTDDITFTYPLLSLFDVALIEKKVSFEDG